MYGAGAPFFDIFSVLVPAILFLGALYVAFAIFQGRSSWEAIEASDITSSVLRIVYTLALAGLIAAFVGFGIEAVYPSPSYPDDEMFFGPAHGEGVAIAQEEVVSQEPLPGEFAEPPPIPPEEVEAEAEYMREMRTYQEELSQHHRVASLLAIGAAALILLLGQVPRFRRLPVIGDGLTLGGLLTLVYGLALGIQVDSNLFRFLTVTAGLAVLLVAISLKLRSGDLQNA